MGTTADTVKSMAGEIRANNISVGEAKLREAYGTHHSKISIYDGADRRLHIVISTANLLESDWECKMQAFYHCSGAEVCKVEVPVS